MAKVNIKDLAKACGKSVTQVSRALNDHDDVSEATKVLVREKSKELGYVPNKNARSLALKSKLEIYVLIFGFIFENTPELFVKKLEGMYRKSEELSIPLNIHYVNKKDISSLSQYMENNDIKRPILIGMDANDSIYKEICLDKFNKEIIILDEFIDKENISSISNDDAFGTRLVLKHINANYPGRVLVIGGDTSFFTAKYRFKDLKENVEFDFYDGLFRQDVACEIISTLDTSIYNSVYCFSDIMALGVRDGLLAKNEEIPIYGYDGLELLKYVKPSIISVKQNEYKKGQKAVEQVINFTSGLTLIEPELFNEKHH